MCQLQNSNVDCIEERRFSTSSLTISMVLYHLLLAKWPSLWYTTIFYLPTGHPYGTPSIFYWHTVYQYGTQPSPYVTLLSSPGPVAQSYGTLPFSTDPLAVSVVHYYLLLSPTCTLAVSMVHFYLLLAHWPFLLYTPIFYWPTGPCMSLWYTTIFYWSTGYLFGTLPSSSCPLAISMIHHYLLLAHWLYLWYTTIYFWPIGCLYYYLLIINWPSLC